MSDYSPYELNQMKADAIRRVNEMQSRAQSFVHTEEEKPPIPIKQRPPQQRPPQQRPPQPVIPPSTRQSKTPRPYPYRTRRVTSEQTNNLLSDLPNKINDILQNDELCEQTLLIALIVLLSQEKADKILIFALLYILAD